MSRISIFISAVLFLLYSYVASAQDTKVVRDMRFILNCGIEKEFLKNWEAGIGTELRMYKNMSHVDKIEMETNVKYSPLKFLKIGAGYEIGNYCRDDETYETRYIAFGQLELKKKLKPFRFEYRFRYQNKDDDFYQSADNNRTDHILKNRLSIAYDIPHTRIRTFMEAEHYGSLFEKKYLSIKMKYIAGCQYKAGKKHKVECYFRIDDETSAFFPYTYYNFGLGYKYEL